MEIIRIRDKHPGPATLFPFSILHTISIRQIPGFLMEADVVGPKIHELVRLAEANEVRGNDPVAPPHQVGNQSDPTVRPERFPVHTHIRWKSQRDNFGDRLETLSAVESLQEFLSRL
jgi:hypothetical protein